jgi:hypothetical protein
MVRYKPTITGQFMILKNWMYAVGMKKAGLWGTITSRASKQMLRSDDRHDVNYLYILRPLP